MLLQIKKLNEDDGAETYFFLSWPYQPRFRCSVATCVSWLLLSVLTRTSLSQSKVTGLGRTFWQ